MRWFGRKAAAKGPRPALTRGFGTRFVTGEWPRNYEAQVRDAYLSNAIAQRAVRLVAESVGGAPLTGSEDEAVKLVSARSGGQGLLESVAANLLLHGNAFVQVLADGEGRAAELFALRPERVSVEPDARGWPTAFLYRVGEVLTRLPAEDAAGRCAVVHIKGFHPLDDHYGAGCLAAAPGLPGEVSVSYYEPARDYQAGVQRARRPGPGRRIERIDLPAALSAPEAKRAAEAQLARIWSERETRTLRLAPRRIDLAPGQLVTVAGEPGLWRVARRTVERMMIELELVRHRNASAVAPEASPGRSLVPPDRPHGPTTLHVLDLPALGDELLSAPRLLIAAAGGPGWRRAALLSSLDGIRWEPLGTTAAPAVMGTTMTALGGARAASFDLLNSVDVQLLHDEMLLQEADDAALVAGANLALVGDELIQFGSAAPLGAGTWRLSRLTRGRRGTEAAIAGHMAGERFVLLEPETLLAFDPPLAALGGQAFILATSVGDAPQGVETVCAISGQTVRPPSPVALTARARPDGGFELSWTRRSRAGWAWLSGSDAPLGEEVERYVLRIIRGDGSARELTLFEPAYRYPAADMAVDASRGSAVIISVAQQGSAALSGEATLTLSIG